MPIEVVQSDITTLAVEAVVNAANPGLLGGGGVDGAIHHAAGPGLLAACRALPVLAPGVRCPHGESRITPGFDLPARWVIHAVGPIWRGGGRGEAALLASCHLGSLALARDVGADSIAFPAISCGVYGYPRDAAAAVVIPLLEAWLAGGVAPRRIVLCAFDAGMAKLWRARSGLS